MDTDISEVDGKSTEISQYCLGLPTVVRQLLKQFCTEHLIELSRVNKLWNFEARSVMKERGNLRANIVKGGRRGDHPCQSLAAFASDLNKMQVVPFSGLHFSFSRPVACKSLPHGCLQPFYKVVLEQVHCWKHLAVLFFDYSDRIQECPALLMLRQLLEKNCGVLEELILGFVDVQPIGSIFQDLTFPSLKSLAVVSLNISSGYLTRNFVKALVSSAPNLQDLHVNATMDIMVNILEETPPNLTFRPIFKSVSHGFVNLMRSDKMELCVERDRIKIDFLCCFIPKLIRATRTKLKTFIMDLLFAMPLMCYQICLENVTTLEIHMNSYKLEQREPSILKLAKGFDFTRTFPKVTRVRILDNDHNPDDNYVTFSSNVIHEFCEDATAVLSKTLPDRATSIKVLDLECCGIIEDSFLVFLAQMFPDVTTVHTKRGHQGAMFEDLWEHFLCLEEVTESEPAFIPYLWSGLLL